MSRMLNGRPSWPIRSTFGSTSVVTFIGRNVTLYFFVGRFTFAGAIYGFTPPIGTNPREKGKTPLILWGFRKKTRSAGGGGVARPAAGAPPAPARPAA